MVQPRKPLRSGVRRVSSRAGFAVPFRGHPIFHHHGRLDTGRGVLHSRREGHLTVRPPITNRRRVCLNRYPRHTSSSLAIFQRPGRAWRTVCPRLAVFSAALEHGRGVRKNARPFGELRDRRSLRWGMWPLPPWSRPPSTILSALSPRRRTFALPLRSASLSTTLEVPDSPKIAKLELSMGGMRPGGMHAL